MCPGRPGQIRDPELPALGSALGRPCRALQCHHPLGPRCCHPPEGRLPMSSAVPSGISSSASPSRRLAPLRHRPGAPEDGGTPVSPAHRCRAWAPGSRFALFQRAESPRWDHPNSLTPRGGCCSRSWLLGLSRCTWSEPVSRESPFPSAANSKPTRR